MRRFLLLILVLATFFTDCCDVMASGSDDDDAWETRVISDALGEGTLKLRRVEDSELRARLPYFSVPVLDPADDESLVDRCADAIKGAVERDNFALVVGELRQGGRAHWYVYASSVEQLDNAYQSISDVCPIMWGNHHDSAWSEYQALHSAS